MPDPTPPRSAHSNTRRSGASAAKRDLVRRLRRQGHSYGEIATSTSTPKSTISLWCRDIVLTQRQRTDIQNRRGSRSRSGTSVDTQWRRRAEIRQIIDDATVFAEAHAHDPLFVAGTCLYWAEGSKTRNDLSITNSDPRILAVFLRFVRTYLDPRASFSLALSLHDPSGEEQAKRYWRRQLSLPVARFTKTYVKQPGSGHRRKRLPHGICRVRVEKGSDHWHRVMAFIDHLGSDLGG